MTPEQISAANKANMETLANLSRKAFEGVEKLMELNIQVAKTMMSEQVEHMKSCASAKDAQDLMAMQAKFVKPFSDAMVALKTGEITQTPVKSQFGFHIIKLEEIRDAQVPPFEEVKGQIAESLQQKKLQAFQQDLKKKAKIK